MDTHEPGVHMKRWLPIVALQVAALLTWACSGEFIEGGSSGDGAGKGGDPCTPGQDSDSDGIPDRLEGCEAGRDTDGDNQPDYLDRDSDNDGLDDGDEDRNGDGILGCCLSGCGQSIKGCPAVKASQCGAGQTCQSGSCQPPVHFLCSDGESDPRTPATFPGGTADRDLPTFVCHRPDEINDKGLKRMAFKKSQAGGWHLALEPTSTYGEAVVAGAKPLEAAATFDLTGQDQAVAGFIVSMPAAGGSVSDISSGLVTRIGQLAGASNVSLLTSGTIKTSHDKHPTVVGTRIAVALNGAQKPPAVRNALIPLLLSRAASQVTNLPPAAFGPASTQVVLAFQTLLRPQEGRVLVMGSVADQAMVQDDLKSAGVHQEDLSNGTGLATLADGDTVECDPFLLQRTPVADIIWVVDESGSMSDNRQDIVNNASDFFARALKAGLDFRMGVAGVKSTTSFLTPVKVGKLCSRASALSSDDGGADRFLLPSEKSIFEACIKNPPYYEPSSEYGLAHTYGAVTSHLPRKPASASDLTRIRKEAALVIIIATDEAPQELKVGSSWNGKAGFLGTGDCDISTCHSAKQAQIDSYIQDWITLLSGKSAAHGAEGRAIVHLIAGVCGKSCGGGLIGGPEFPWGYQELVKATGGQIADICQQNLGSTLQLIIDSVSGAASPVVLQYVPISASLSVALGKTRLERSRAHGFDYASASNSLVFVGVQLKKGDRTVASYRRWTRQAVIE